MSNIKYRQFVNGKFHYWGFLQDEFTEKLCFVGPVTSNQSNAKHGQFTGLTDKNGEEIYEGDILKCHGYSGVVGFDKEEPRFAITPIGEAESLALIVYEMHHFEVIGNIYENPELLK